ncbi:multiheme c-type cytochrome [Candidatus Marinimicrobia bacterium]|nr:multiheme c-type cytochrome [Candidatus Neomarinimicrobiota bacterium]
MYKKVKKYSWLFIFCSIIICQCNSYDYGDINLDDNLNIIDVTLAVDLVFDIENYYSIADLNQDYYNNIYDLIIMIDRILNPFELDIDFIDIEFNFTQLNLIWNKTYDQLFSSYNIYYSNFLNNQEDLIYSTTSIIDTSITIENILLNEQNYFSIGIKDLTGCELITNQRIYELPFKDFNINEAGEVGYTEFNVSDFKPSIECASCHQEHYEEWFSSMHSYTSRSPLFFSYKNEVNVNHSQVGEKFCMQCHNPVSFLTDTETSMYNSVNEFQNSNLDDVIKDGIGCDVCHTVTGLSQTVHTQDNLFATAEYKMYPLGNIKFGPIQNPEENSYHSSYYLPTYNSSQMCLPCHDLVIRDIEAEITFTEWNRIPGFSMFGGVSCQNCHMPEKDNGYHSHKFVGVDIDLDIPLSENEMKNDVQNLLETSASISFGILDQEIVDSISPGQVLNIPITVESNTAHSIPSGTSFNRQVWVELIITNNDIIFFESGKVETGEQLDFSDEELLFFATYIYDEDNNLTHNVTETHSIENNALLAYQKRYKNYEQFIPDNLEGSINIDAKILFRPFDPEFILQHHPEFIDNLPIYVISSISKSILIQ